MKTKKPRKFTVILQYPDFISANFDGINETMLIYKKGKTVGEAISRAQDYAMKKNNPPHSSSPEDWNVISVFRGHLRDVADE